MRLLVRCLLLLLVAGGPAFGQPFEAVALPGLTDQPVGTFSAAWEDLDGDGDLDVHLVLPSHQHDDVVFKNEGGLFAAWGPTKDQGYPTSNSALVDLENDGYPDAVVTSLVTRQAVYLGGAHGVDASPSQQLGDDRVRDLDAADVDGDGDLDLLLARRQGGVNLLLRNDQARLEHATQGDLAALQDDAISVSFADHDGDGDPDLYVTGWSGNLLFEHDGGTWVERPQHPLSFGAPGAGSCWGDYDADGDLDAYVTTQTGAVDRFFQNQRTTFVENAALISEPDATNSCAWGDLDLDGDLDLVVARKDAPTLLFMNDGDGFSRRSLGGDYTTYSLAVVDADQDGDLDLFAANGGPDRLEPNEFFRNAQQDGRAWVIVEPEGVVSNRQAVGAHVYATTFDGVWNRQLREVEVRSGQRTQSGTLAHFGLGGAERVDLEVRWPSGQVQVLKDVDPNQRVDVEEALAPASVAATPTAATRLPADGGDLFYTLRGINFTDAPQTYDLWAYAYRPDGTRFGPVVGPVAVTLEPGARLDEAMRAHVPAKAPPGTYLGTAYLGDFEAGTVVSESSLHFHKEDGPPAEAWVWTTEFVATGEVTEVPVSPATPIATDTDATPDAFALRANYPNPFGVTTRIEYDLPVRTDVRLEVFDLTGRLVRVLDEGARPAGTRTVRWEGRDASGRPVANGVYLYRLRAGSYVESRRLVLMR